ncbi:MAG: hypothetical protein Q8R53_03880 [Nanoarchaeota archaeon]|nr:hypothetical protein [Nanoarchaeota archaeon]
MAPHRRKQLQKGSSLKNIRRSSFPPLSQILLTVFLLLILVSLAFFVGKLSGVPQWKIVIMAISSDVGENATKAMLIAKEVPITPPNQEPQQNLSSSSVPFSLPPPPEMASLVSPPTLPEEPIITTYAQVEFLLNDVGYEWLDSHGRILELDYTIVNNEAGTILPHYFVLEVEGYTDIRKNILLARNSQRIPAHRKLSTQLPLQSPGFTYAESVTGDLANVRITLSLYDGEDVLLDAFVKEFDLRGKNMTVSS